MIKSDFVGIEEYAEIAKRRECFAIPKTNEHGQLNIL